MTKAEIRAFLKDIILEKPKSKWQAITKIWDRAIWISASTLVAITALATNNMGTLMILIWTLILGLVIMYLMSKGR